MVQMFPNQENVHEQMMKLLNVQLSLTNLGMEKMEIDQKVPKVVVVAMSHKSLPLCIKKEIIEVSEATATSVERSKTHSPDEANAEEEQLPPYAEIREVTDSCNADQTVAIDYENVKKSAQKCQKIYQDNKESKKIQFKCHFCEFTTYTRISLKKHELVHKIPKAHKCEQCSKAFNTKEKLFAHKKEHSAYFCSRCKRDFSQMDEKDKHEKSCKLSGHYCCKQCDFTCNSKLGLMNHERTHIELLSCEHCNKLFSSNWNLQQHKKSILRRSVA